MQTITVRIDDRACSVEVSRVVPVASADVAVQGPVVDGFGAAVERLLNTPIALSRFVKIGVDGKALPQDAAEWAAVFDTESGLTWTRDTLGEESVTHAKAIDIAGASRCAGFSDWRLPTIRELQSIIDYGRSDPAIDTGVFPGTKSAWYWSSSPYVGGEDYAWQVDFDYGYAYINHRDGKAFVRAVRGPSQS